MSEDTIALPFDLPSVCRKKVSIGFDGGRRRSSDAGVLLLRGVEKTLGLGPAVRYDCTAWGIFC